MGIGWKSPGCHSCSSDSGASFHRLCLGGTCRHTWWDLGHDQHLAGPPRGCLQIIAFMAPSRAALSILFPALLANFLPGFGRDAKRLRSPLTLLKGIGHSPKGKPRYPFTMLLELSGSKRAMCYVCVLLFDIFKPSSSALVLMPFYTSLKGIVIMQDRGPVGEANRLILKGKSNIFKVLGFLAITPNSPLYELWIRASLLHIAEVRDSLHPPETVQLSPHTSWETCPLEWIKTPQG